MRNDARGGQRARAERRFVGQRDLGIEVLCGHLSRALQARGYEIAVVSDDREGRREVEETLESTAFPSAEGWPATWRRLSG